MKSALKRTPSLALRLTFSIGAGISLVLLCFGWLIDRSINTHFVHQDINELNAARQSIQSAVLATGQTTETLRERFNNAISGHHNAEFLVVNANGAVVYATPGGADLNALITDVAKSPVIDETTVSLWAHEGRTYRSAVVEIPNKFNADKGPFTVALATDIGFHLHYLNSFHSYLRWLTLLACLIAIGTTWIAVYQGHAPLRRISRQINGISADQLHLRLDLSELPSELTPLAKAFNEMINRLEDGFQRLSNFSADIAHELRTPITNLTTQTQVALSKTRTAPEYREVLYSGLEEFERMTKMVGDMLFLAQADSQLIEPERANLKIIDELQSLFEFFEAWAEEQDVTLIVHGNNEQILGDRLMLRRALSNLLSNAIRHAPKGQSVQVVVSADETQITIQITNSGPSISPAHLEHLFERFYRPDASRQRNGEGAGLGLAIAQSIIKAHGGRILVKSQNELTTFEIQLPKIDNP